MSKLFEPTMINGLKLNNRFLRSATFEGMAGDDGSVTPTLVDLLIRLAQGGVGMIISSHAYIKPEGQAGPRQLGVYADALVPGLRELTRAVHEAGGKIVMQLAHSGGFANPKLTGRTALAPSAPEGFYKTPPREMTLADIQEMVEAFGLAALRARAAGFDGVEIHAAHGYLLSQFISPLLNLRLDDYGGTVENRYRALGQVVKKIRATVGPDFPILIKLNSQDFLEGGLTLEDSLQIGARLQEDGLDAIELSGGVLISKNLSPSRTGITTEEKEAYFSEEARAFKKKVSIPLLLVGGIRSFSVAERIIDQGVADYISMSRPFIREPGLIQRWRSGDLRPALCLSDNQCFRTIMADAGLHCVVEKKEKEKGTEIVQGVGMKTSQRGQEKMLYSAEEIKKICLEAGADDVGLVDMERASLEKEREGILHVYSLTRSIISIITTNNRENLQSPARYVANEEYHHTGDRTSDLSREILRRLNRIGIRGVVVNKGWPMNLDQYPGKIWDVSHKIMAVEAGLGHMGLNRLVLHPKFGSAIQLDSILINGVVDQYDQPLTENPCFHCNLCAVVCPTGAITRGQPFDFVSCITHTYRDNMTGFQDWVEAMVTSQNMAEYGTHFNNRETAFMWQSLMFRMSYRCSYCMAVCPAGEEVKPGYLENKKEHVERILKPLRDRQEPVYVTAGSKAEARVKKNPHKIVRVVPGMMRTPPK